NQLRIDSQGTPVGQTTPLLAADGGDAVVVDTLVIAGPGVLVETPPGVSVVADDVAILNGAVLTHAACTDTLTNRLDLTVSDTLLVDPTAAIDVSGRGYLPGRSVGNVPPTPEQKSFGGSHGGLGRIGSWGGTVPASYDDIRDPALPGGGGSGTAGGGVVHIHAGTILLEGAIRANGVSGWGGISGGAGGSVRVQTDVLSGAGSVSADGGAAGMGDYASTGGSGGGGRVAIYYGSLDGFDVAGRVSAHSAASPAGPGSVGTVYLQPEGGVSELRVVSHGIATGTWTPLLPGPDGWVRLGSVTIAGAGVEVAAMDGAPIDCADIAVLDGANLTHPSPSAAATFALEVHASGTLHVDATSRIDVSGRGSPGGTTLGVRALGSSKSRSGGSYGGKGYGNFSNTLYGRPDNPLWPGSAGDTAGGGLVRLHAAAMQIDGAVRANGVPGVYYWAMAAGSGGGILINTVDWGGEGTVEALGGNGNWGDYGSNGGSGGGGRIAVYVAGQQAVSVPALSAAGGSGGSGIGGAGTAVLTTAPSFFWTDPRPAVAGAEISLGWELLGAPAGTTVDLFAGPVGGDQAPLAAALPPVGSFLWDTSALPPGLYTLRLAYGAAGGAVAGEATRTVLVHHEGILHGGRLASDESWAAGVLHIVTDDLEIPSGVTLTLAAGALVKVAEGRTLRVLPGGALVSGGTPGAPAVFTSLRDDSLGGDDNADGALTSPAPGDWGGIRVETGTALPASDILVLRYGTREHGGSLAASAVWPADTLHWVRDDVTVPGGMTLSVEPGATVVFDYGRVLSVSGTLQAIGAIGAPIRMTSSYDSGAFGMAYGPYAGHMPAPGDWHCVYVGDGGAGTFDRVHFRYGAGRQTGYDSTAMVRGRRSTVVLQNCRIEDTQYDGVLVDWPTDTTRTELVNCVVAGCDIGFRAADNAAGICQVVNSSFYDNRIGVHLAWGSTSNPRVVRNSIIAESREIGYYLWGGGTVFESNNVWGSGTTDYSGGLANQTGKTGNISADPRFRAPDQGDFNLMPTSPCIDAANGTYAPATDFAGLARNDFPRVPDTGVPMPGGVVVPDMGALEYSQHVNTNIDLVVTAVRGPALATAGDAVTVSWDVVNRGTEEVSGWRRDRVGLATAAQQRGEVSLTCGTAAFTDTIRPGQTVTYEAVVTVPGGTPGVWNWSVTTNAFDDVAEGANRVNNTGLSARTVTLGLPALVLNAPTAVSGQLGAAGAAAWYAVTIPAGQDAIIRVDAGAGDARLRLYAGRGFLPTIYDYDWQSPASGADPRLALPASSGEQTLYVLVVAEDLPSGPTTFTATAAELVFALDACDRRSGGNAGNTTVRLTGAGFTPDLAVGLRGGGGTIPATGVTVLNSGEAYAVLDLKGAATGVYDVVAQVGGLESVLPAAFTVTAGKGWDFRCRVTAPPLVRPDRPFPVLIEFENTGDSDCPPIMMTVTNDGG
ncbi:MAG: hypothetical protein GX595_09640, partial [Lentisphaerae bacterium]|nr:hypothetical protein [Lentisphaerota bacterium]